VKALHEELDRRGVRVPFVGHDLVEEIEGKASSVKMEGLFRGAG
jgi:hypothetical protein